MLIKHEVEQTIERVCSKQEKYSDCLEQINRKRGQLVEQICQDEEFDSVKDGRGTVQEPAEYTNEGQCNHKPSESDIHLICMQGWATTKFLKENDYDFNMMKS